ncbi:hypothetical protein [Oceanihabitans sediminis]|uniref:Uncharacterized protein n=1 Tax=Oceanihabitans sediminis TaxID=1812012 RepID=A0A368P8D0_9FLAO|nr:hypothetical protein [Oceanihabitans sediminis]MDX1278697.1 hypothetical protein [Oceanihabitans sediminis]MDX1773010.1 hypothetical protein [Oceanihabitans sediminis]RBP34702.1 hypothetical protein DFR65_101599 [Oceanihabitans sediminis]RCU58354.1 hypothetical protein DU428_02975 [Oceanihabitans sediminis]
MKTQQKLLTKISELLLDIQNNHHELYVHLDENPIAIPTLHQSTVDKKCLEDYLSSLKTVFKKYINKQKKSSK